jgi:hypothetical protein
MPTETPSSAPASSAEIQKPKPAEGPRQPPAPEKPQAGTLKSREELAKKVETGKTPDPSKTEAKPTNTPSNTPAPAEQPWIWKFLKSLITPTAILGAITSNLRVSGLSLVADFLDRYLGVDTRLLAETMSAQELTLQGWFIPIWRLMALYDQLKVLRPGGLLKDQFFRELTGELRTKLGSGAEVPFESVVTTAQEMVKKARDAANATRTATTPPSNSPTSAPTSSLPAGATSAPAKS